MKLTVTTWNINSVRLRIDLVAKFIKATRPDVLCLQETKCPDDAFPMKRFKRLGYEYAAISGQKGYHGVAILSRLPLDSTLTREFCKKADCRHISVALGEKAGLKDPVTLHNFYVPAGGDPHEHDVWSHKQLLDVVSHTPIECEKLLALQKHGNWIDVARARIPMSEKIYTWWSYRAADWKASNRGRRLDHIWVSPALGDRVSDFRITQSARDWERPSDHVPVTMSLEV